MPKKHSSPHVLFLLDYYAPHQGGVENVFEHVIEGLLQQGYTITLITSRFDPQLAKKETKGGLTIHRVGTGRISFFFACFSCGMKILRAHPEIQLIHASTYTSGIPASLLGGRFGKPRILTVHEIFGTLRKRFKPRYSRRLFQLFEWFTFQVRYEAYHCVSLYTLNSLRMYYGIPDQKLHLVYNGVDTEFWDAQRVSESERQAMRRHYGRGDAPVALYYGHAGISKGLDFLVEALPVLEEKFPEMHYVFNLIPSKRTATLKQRILESSSLEQAVSPARTVISGLPKEQLRVLVACSDVVIAPSLAEGFGSVHSEVCSMGKPLLTTQVAAIPEVVSGEVIFVSPASSDAIIEGFEKWRTGDFCSLQKKDFSREKSLAHILLLYSKFLKSQ